MATLTAVLTHLSGPLVRGQLAYLRALSPDSRFVVGHGGPRADFDAIGDPHAIFIDDPTLRGPPFDKSLDKTLRRLYDAFVRDDPAIDHLFAIEYDHLVLRAGFEREMTELATRSGAGLLAKSARACNDTNWSHYLKVRGDRRLDDFIASISVRDDPTLRFGCLGTGLLLRRDALEAYCSMPAPPDLYVEMFVPTALYHLGFDVVDVDAVSDLYAEVRWVPEFTVADALAARGAGRFFVHPFKQLDRLRELQN